MSIRTALITIVAALAAVPASAVAADDPDTLEVVADEAAIVVGDKVLATVKKGDKLSRVRWVAVELERDGKIIRGWIRAEDVAVAGDRKAPVLPPEPNPKATHKVQSHAQRIKLLETVFANRRAWSEHRFTISKGSITLTNKQIGRLEKVIKMRGTWPAKLNVMAHVTPIDVRVYCNPDGMVPIGTIIDAFGPAEKMEKGVICNIAKFNPRPVEAARGNAKMIGTWHRYGSIRLGVTDGQEILVVQVWGQQWRDEQKRWKEQGGK